MKNSDKKMVAFAMAFVVFAGRSIFSRGDAGSAATPEHAIAAGKRFADEIEKAELLPEKGEL